MVGAERLGATSVAARAENGAVTSYTRPDPTPFVRLHIIPPIGWANAWIGVSSKRILFQIGSGKRTFELT